MSPPGLFVCRLTAGYSQVGSGNLGKWEGPLKTARVPWAAIPRVSLEGCDDCLLLPAPELAPICLKERMFREKAAKRFQCCLASGNVVSSLGKLAQVLTLA